MQNFSPIASELREKGAMKICQIMIRRIAVLPKICSVESPLLPKTHSVELTIH